MDNSLRFRSLLAATGLAAVALVVPAVAAAQAGWGRYPRYAYGFDDRASLRIDVTPVDAQVFVDGYSAGVVDDFDGFFQRLRLPPGGHEVVVYRDGYQTLRRNVYLQPDAVLTIREEMRPLAAGETTEPPPVPDASRRDVRAPRPDEGASVSGTRPVPARFGTLALHVDPEDAEIFVDGDRSTVRATDGNVDIRLSEGRHRIEVRKDGFARYTEDVLIRRGATLTLNVALTR